MNVVLFQSAPARPVRPGRAARGVLAAAAVFAASAGAAAPSARCAAPEHDFGKGSFGATVRHVFRVANAGDSNLTLRVAVVCCGSKVSVSAPSLASGKAALVSVEITLPSRPGWVRRAVYLATNDPSTPYLRLCLSGRVPEEAGGGGGGITKPGSGAAPANAGLKATGGP